MQTEKTGKIERFPGLKGREETRKTEMEQRNVEGRACVAQREKVESKASLGFCAASSNRMYTRRWAVLTESGCALAPFDIRVRCYKTWRHEVEFGGVNMRRILYKTATWLRCVQRWLQASTRCTRAFLLPTRQCYPCLGSLSLFSVHEKKLFLDFKFVHKELSFYFSPLLLLVLCALSNFSSSFN
jgi:hypothetical protein